MAELKLFAGRSNRPLAEKIAANLEMPLGNCVLKNFSDGEMWVKFSENIRGTDVFIVQSTNPPAQNLLELLIMIDAAKRASARKVTAVIPYFGYARQDRKDQPRVSITAKLIANLITVAGADRVITMDLHAPQIQGFFDIPVDHLYASTIFYDYLKKFKEEDLIVISPDVGGMKMAAAYADMLGTDFGFVAKKRKDALQVEATSVVGDVEGKSILIVDDLTESAGTLQAAAKLLKEKGARKVRAAVSHAVLNEKGYERMKEGFLDELITTNSTPVDCRGLPITILSIAPLMGEAMLRINNHQSVTSLFRIKGF